MAGIRKKPVTPHPRPEKRKRTPIGQRHPLLRQLLEDIDRTTTQHAISTRSAVAVGTIKQLRSGRLRDPRLGTFLALAEALGYDVELRKRQP